ncbi:hypothetical protein LTR56_019661 [Elasticomyces elasticus]|nr:hypothetical protein LTR56_019661 [Elasticomyces elasticus]KAK3662352.1 hypothetical protein LTR22_006885 [Elasticomyces elasticus]KAK4924709.1 hypothetical protein LTR49_008158 [Elasticomyces elasticus]KAK5766885.1 hypothetical protein LTS12_002961 [Elasticomyces elasticus]
MSDMHMTSSNHARPLGLAHCRRPITRFGMFPHVKALTTSSASSASEESPLATPLAQARKVLDNDTLEAQKAVTKVRNDAMKYVDTATTYANYSKDQAVEALTENERLKMEVAKLEREGIVEQREFMHTT